MKNFSFLISLTVCVLFSPNVVAQDQLIIAHRGASGYLPEHTLEAKVLAHAMGADYIEQDVVMTQDNQLVVLHDLTLDRTTNVAELYPGRQRDDGQFYVIDFTLAELRQLSISEGFSREPDNDAILAVFPELFPLWQARFQIHTLAEELELIQELNAGSGRNVGIYTEIKSPWFHHLEGKDLSSAVLSTLKHYGYISKNDKVYLQSFDFNELKLIHDELLDELEMDLKLVQLIAETEWQETFEIDSNGQLVPFEYDWMLSNEGIGRLSEYVEGIGPNIGMIINPDSTPDNIMSTDLVANAHNAGLEVHAYTFRADPGALPPYARNFTHMLELFFLTQNVDGVFTDHPDKAVDFLRHNLPQ